LGAVNAEIPREKGGIMFFLLLTAMIISFVVGTTLLINGEMVFGILSTALGILLLLFILFYYGRKKYRKKKYDCTPDFPTFDCGPDCDGKSDCDGGPDCDCDCGPNCN
jgi:hypothetical protein